MPALRNLLTAAGFGAVPAVVFAAGVYLDPADLAAHGMPVSLAAMGVVVAGMVELVRRTPA